MFYLDLKKAVQIPSVGTDAHSDRHAVRKYNESFGRRHSGVVGGDLSPDRPEVGKKWKAPKEGEALDDELETERQEDNKLAADRGIIPEKPESTKKALDVLKSFSSALGNELSVYNPNPREIEFLTEVRGYSLDEVMKGRVQIVGRERAMFHEWLTHRLQKSISRLAR